MNKSYAWNIKTVSVPFWDDLKEEQEYRSGSVRDFLQAPYRYKSDNVVFILCKALLMIIEHIEQSEKPKRKKREKNKK